MAPRPHRCVLPAAPPVIPPSTPSLTAGSTAAAPSSEASAASPLPTVTTLSDTPPRPASPSAGHAPSTASPVRTPPRDTVSVSSSSPELPMPPGFSPAPRHAARPPAGPPATALGPAPPAAAPEDGTPGPGRRSAEHLLRKLCGGAPGPGATGPGEGPQGARVVGAHPRRTSLESPSLLLLSPDPEPSPALERGPGPEPVPHAAPGTAHEDTCSGSATRGRSDNDTHGTGTRRSSGGGTDRAETAHDGDDRPRGPSPQGRPAHTRDPEHRADPPAPPACALPLADRGADPAAGPTPEPHSLPHVEPARGPGAPLDPEPAPVLAAADARPNTRHPGLTHGGTRDPTRTFPNPSSGPGPAHDVARDFTRTTPPDGCAVTSSPTGSRGIDRPTSPRTATQPHAPGATARSAWDAGPMDVDPDPVPASPGPRVPGTSPPSGPCVPAPRAHPAAPPTAGAAVDAPRTDGVMDTDVCEAPQGEHTEGLSEPLGGGSPQTSGSSPATAACADPLREGHGCQGALAAAGAAASEIQVLHWRCRSRRGAL